MQATEDVPPEEADVDVPLAELIQTLRQELEQAMGEGVGKDLRFELVDIDLELTVTVARRTAKKGGIAIKVITLGAERGAELGSTHTIRLKLHPNEDILIANSGQPEPE